MLGNEYTQRIMPGWLKWLLVIISLLIISSLIFGIYLYLAVQKNKTSSYEQIKETVIQETELRTVSQIERFHGDKAYYIVYGETEDKTEKIIFYPFSDEDSDILTLKQSDIVTKETIKSDWKNACNSCTMIDIKPALTNGDDVQPAWEVTYEDNSNRYVMEYFSVSDGTRIEVLRFNRLYNGESE